MNSKIGKSLIVAEPSCAKKMRQQERIAEEQKGFLVIGLDLSDRTACYAVLGPNGEDRRAEKKMVLTREALRRHFEA